MTQEHRDFVDQLIVKFQAAPPNGVTGVANWVFYRYEPIQHQGRGQNCAVWFAAESIDTDHAASGSMEIVEEYHVRYWEPAPEAASGAVLDPAAALTVETIYEDVRRVIYANQAGLSTVYQAWFVSGAFLIGGEAERNIRGFEQVLTARRRTAFA